MSAFMEDLEEPIRAVLDRFFAEEHLVVTVTYRLYQGQNELGEDSFNEFPLTVIAAGKSGRNMYQKRGSPIQTGNHTFIVRDIDLPQSITIDDLSTNDRIVPRYGAEELLVVEIDRTLGFVVEVQARGA